MGTIGGERRSSVIRYALGGLLAFGAVNAVAGGYYGLSGAAGVPLEWLEGSPFRDYFVPSLVLLVVVGGSLLAGMIAVFTKSRVSREAGLGAGTVVLIWISVQMSVIGYVSWMQPATAAGGVLILGLSWLLPRRGAPLDQTR